jgi:hypothetical protein
VRITRNASLQKTDWAASAGCGFGPLKLRSLHTSGLIYKFNGFSCPKLRISRIFNQLQMRLQQAMLEELKALRASNSGHPETPAAAQAPPVIEEDSFIPDSLRPLYGKRRR